MSSLKDEMFRWAARANGRRRMAIGTAIVAAVVVIVVVAAVAGYFFLSSTSTSKSTSQVKTSSTSQTTSSTTSSSSATQASTSGGLSPFQFSLEQASDALISPGGYDYVVVLKVSHSLGSGGEFVTLNSTSPAGITVQFSPSSPVALPPGADANVTVDITAASNATLGNDTIGVQGVAGGYSQTATFNLVVVPYNIFMSPSTNSTASVFYPSILNVTVGSTVYWQNLDGPMAVCGDTSPGTGDHNVVFTTLPAADSQTIKQFQVYNYTFTTPGSYFYYSSLDSDHSMNGTINVLAPDGGGIGMVPRIPTFSYFKNDNVAAVSIPPRSGNQIFSSTKTVLHVLSVGPISMAIVITGALSRVVSHSLSHPVAIISAAGHSMVSWVLKYSSGFSSRASAELSRADSIRPDMQGLRPLPQGSVHEISGFGASILFM